MANVFRLPDIGEGLTDAEIVRWHVAVGDKVAENQLLVEVETAKAVVEITSPFAGTVLHLGAAEGDVVEVGEVLVVVGDPGERWPPDGEAPASVGEATGPGAQTPETSAPTAVPGPSGRIRAMPIVRRLAREHGIDLTAIVGTGPGGAITRADVEAAIAAADRRTEEPAAGTREDERIPMSRLRRTIAENLARSWREIPHVTVQADVDATALLAAHGELKTRGGPAPLEALVAQAVLPALRRHREFNAVVDGDDVVYRHRYDLGFAVDTEEGLMVVVVRDADRLGVDELGARIAELADRARKRTATPEELTGQTFTISNIGALGGGPGTPIIPWGTSAILSIGRAVEKPVVRGGGIFVAPIAPLNLSYDHRLIDGSLGQRFLADVVEGLEGLALPG